MDMEPDSLEEFRLRKTIWRAGEGVLKSIEGISTKEEREARAQERSKRAAVDACTRTEFPAYHNAGEFLLQLTSF